MGRLYHYTSAEAHDQIRAGGVIKQSQNSERDCCYGDGVYLTTIDPHHFAKEDIAKNNYGGGWRARLAAGKLDYYVELEIPYSDLKLQKCEADGRDVFLYSGDIVLSRFSWQSGRNSEWSYVEVLGCVAAGAVAVGLGALLGKVIYDACTAKPEPDKKKKMAGREK